MIGTKLKATASPPPLPTVPAIDNWRAMTASQRLDFQIEVLDALSDPVVAMSEGRPHKKAKTRALDALSLHFRAIGRTIYLAEEMAVLYPGEKPLSPDLLAVLDVEEPEEDERMSWVVADEGKGLNLVIEVVHKGDRTKDLVENVERYAALGIPEYFVYDRGAQQIHGFRLGAPGSTRYQPIVPQHGHFRSNVLGLDFAILGNALRFLVGEAELPGSAEPGPTDARHDGEPWCQGGSGTSQGRTGANTGRTSTNTGSASSGAGRAHCPPCPRHRRARGRSRAHLGADRPCLS